MTGRWKIEGYDTFAGERYPIAGSYDTEQAAIDAAQAQLRELEIRQPSSASEGQSGIQDRVYVVAPDGVSYLVLPS